MTARWWVKAVVGSVLGLVLLGANVARAQSPTPKPASTAPSAEGVVNLNEASPDELERLPGIGPAKAKLIFDHRKGHPFRRVEDVTKVKGIGRKTFAKLRPYLTLQGATTLASEPAKK